ncbi:hypothetical protein RCL1_004810 [Eukaryota sp. TZLM3-RCL]
MMSWNDWMEVGSFFQCTDITANGFLQLLPKLTSRVHRNLLESVVSFGLVCFPDSSTRSSLKRFARTVKREVWYFDLEQQLVPYVTASLALEQKSIGSFNVVQTILKDVSLANEYALLGLLYRASLRLEPLQAIELFFLRPCAYKHRLFLGVWRCLLAKLKSKHCLHLVLGRFACSSTFLKQVYIEYLEDYSFPQGVLCFDTPYVRISVKNEFLHVNEKTLCRRSLACQKVALNYCLDNVEFKSVIYSCFAQITALSVDEYQDKICLEVVSDSE